MDRKASVVVADDAVDDAYPGATALLFQDLSAIATGGASGLGEATARSLSSVGARITVTMVLPAVIVQRLKSLVESQGGQ